MPRGKKRSALESIQEQLVKIDSEIEKYQNKIKELQAKKEELAQQKKKQELDELLTKIQASGKTVDEVLNAIG